jgi:hypothetical protein
MAKLAAPDPDALFSAKEISTFIEHAFTAAVNPAFGDAPLSEERLGYCRNFALQLVLRLDAQDIQTGHMSYQEGVAMLLGAALAMQKLHGKGDE